jgi:hypothetical protein
MRRWRSTRLVWTKPRRAWRPWSSRRLGLHAGNHRLARRWRRDAPSSSTRNRRTGDNQGTPYCFSYRRARGRPRRLSRRSESRCSPNMRDVPVWQHPPYFHNGSATTLEDVVNAYDPRRTLGLSAVHFCDRVMLGFLEWTAWAASTSPRVGPRRPFTGMVHLGAGPVAAAALRRP